MFACEHVFKQIIFAIYLYFISESGINVYFSYYYNLAHVLRLSLQEECSVEHDGGEDGDGGKLGDR